LPSQGEALPNPELIAKALSYYLIDIFEFFQIDWSFINL
jgi:hypothetical protein